MIYRYKATLPQHKNFLRIYEARANTTLYALHLFLQNNLSFSPDQQVFFKTYNASGKQVSEYGLFDMGFGAMDQIQLETIQAKGQQELHYVFDIFKGRYLTLQFDGEVEEVMRRVYPCTIQERGTNPDQFRDEQLSSWIDFEERDVIQEEEGE